MGLNPEVSFYTNKIRVNPERPFRKALLEERLVENERRLIEEYIAE